MDKEHLVPETKGVTVKLLDTIDLGPEIADMAGHQFRMRLVTFEPGSVFGPLHDHKGRPGLVYILQGTITDHRNGIATDYGPGLGWPEDRKTMHWLENRGSVPAVEISVDIVRPKETSKARHIATYPYFTITYCPKWFPARSTSIRLGIVLRVWKQLK